MNRLATIAPDIDQQLGSLSREQLRAVARNVAEWIVEVVHLEDPRLEAGLASLREMRTDVSVERRALQGLVDELDERAWDIQEDVDQGLAQESEYLVAFSMARAASAVWFALAADALEAASEAVYEAQAATGDLVSLRGRLGRLTRG
jgi:hypothetical protein